ncbi:unnamed protein product, partial [Durusdinium trenchii]
DLTVEGARQSIDCDVMTCDESCEVQRMGRAAALVVLQGDDGQAQQAWRPCDWSVDDVVVAGTGNVTELVMKPQVAVLAADNVTGVWTRACGAGACMAGQGICVCDPAWHWHAGFEWLDGEQRCDQSIAVGRLLWAAVLLVSALEVVALVRGLVVKLVRANRGNRQEMWRKSVLDLLSRVSILTAAAIKASSFWDEGIKEQHLGEHFVLTLLVCVAIGAESLALVLFFLRYAEYWRFVAKQRFNMNTRAATLKNDAVRLKGITPFFLLAPTLVAMGAGTGVARIKYSGVVLVLTEMVLVLICLIRLVKPVIQQQHDAIVIDKQAQKADSAMRETLCRSYNKTRQIYACALVLLILAIMGLTLSLSMRGVYRQLATTAVVAIFLSKIPRFILSQSNDKFVFSESRRSSLDTSLEYFRQVTKDKELENERYCEYLRDTETFFNMITSRDAEEIDTLLDLHQSELFSSASAMDTIS